MKKLIVLFLFAVFSGSVFTSCSNDDSPSTPSSATIVGKWNVSKMSFTIDGVTTPEIVYSDNEPGCPKNYIEFKTGGTYNEGDYTGSTCVLDLSTGTWSLEGNQLTFTVAGEATSVEILSVTNSTLKAKYTDGTDSATVTFTKA